MKQSRRRRLAVMVAVVAMASGVARAQAAGAPSTGKMDLTGSWQGTVDIGKGQRIVLKVVKGEGAGGRDGTAWSTTWTTMWGVRMKGGTRRR